MHKVSLHKPDARSAGFTLIEAMVALVIVSLGMMAVYMQLDRYAVGETHLENKTIASWIATNRLTELSIQAQWPPLGKTESPITFGGREWTRHVNVLTTPVRDIRRVEVSVALAAHPNDPIQTVTGFLEPPVPAGIGGVRWSLPLPAAPEPDGVRR